MFTAARRPPAVPATLRRLLILVSLATLLALLAAPPALAETSEPILAAGVVHAGIYAGETDLDGGIHDGPEDNSFYDHRVTSSFAVGERRVTFAGRFHNVDEADHQRDGFNTVTLLEQAWLANATPFSNVDIKDTAAAVAAGHWDGDIRHWASNVQRWLARGEGRSVVIAPLQEMNGTWVPYGCDPANFKAAYRRFVDIFRGLGMDETLVRWSFAPNGWTSPSCGRLADYYPGDDYVDVIGISAYNFSGVSGSPWSTPYQALIDPVNELRTFAPNKPYLVAQTASPSAGGDKNLWVKQLFDFVAADQNLVGFIWFNIDKVEGSPAKLVDWTVASGGTAGWRGGMQQPTTAYEWPLASWFRPGELRVGGTAGGLAPQGAEGCPEGRSCDAVGLVDSGARFELYEAGGTKDFYFGNPGDFPLMGDWNCDGVPTPGQYRQTDGYVYLRNSNTSGVGEIRFFFGDPGDVPLVGDFDGDGCDTVSIYRPDAGQIFIINSLGADDGGLGAGELTYFFGDPGDKPFVGDFDGDGVDTVGLHRETTGLVYFNNRHDSRVADSQFIFGDPGDRIVAGDWNGDGADSPALYRPSTGMVFMKYTNSGGAADRQFFAGLGFESAVLAPAS